MTDFEAGAKAMTEIAKEVMHKGIAEVKADADQHMINTLQILQKAMRQLAAVSTSQDYTNGVNDALGIIDAGIESLRPN